VSVLHLADGPAMYLGGSIMTFALPYGAFIVIATALFFLYRRPHHGPRLKYLTSGAVTSVLTREPGPIPAPAAGTEAAAEKAPDDTAAAKPETGVDAAGETGSSAPEGKE
jgi:hypothetical protein